MKDSNLGLKTLISKLFATAALVVTANVAQADIIFLNLNGSATEIPAAQAVANANGERLYLVPKNPGAISADEYVTEKVFEELKGLALQGVRPRTLIVSGHHAREQGFWGKNGEVWLYHLQSRFPKTDQPGHLEVQEFFASLQSVYLWGCYTAGLSYITPITSRQNKAFPNVQFIAGFGEKGPINTDPLSGKMLSEILRKESILRAGTMQQAFDILKSIPASQKRDLIFHRGKEFVSRDGWSNQDVYVRSCVDPVRKQRLGNSIKTIWEYYQGQRGPIPEDTSKGELRMAYQELQRYKFCIGMGAVQFPEFTSIPSMPSTLLLIFYKNVMKNFMRQHSSDLISAAADLKAGGFSGSEFLLRFSQLERTDLIRNLQSLHAQLDTLFPEKGTARQLESWKHYNNLIRDLMTVVYADAELPVTWIDLDDSAKADFDVLGKSKSASATPL